MIAPLPGVRKVGTAAPRGPLGGCRAYADLIMSTNVPSWKGISAVALAVFSGFYLPSLTPAHGAPFPRRVWLIGSAVLVLCIVASVLALFGKTRADKVAGILSGVLSLWMSYAFYDAIS